MKHWVIILLVLSTFAIGFFIGREMPKRKLFVQLKDGKEVSKPIPIPDVDRYDTPNEYSLPTRPETVVINNVDTVIQKVDTAKIIEEYIRVNRYDFNLFDGEYGKLDIRQSTQYNKIANIDYTFTPKYKEIKDESPTFIPFVGVAFNSSGNIGLGGGLFIDNIGIEYQYYTNNTHEIGIKYSFR